MTNYKEELGSEIIESLKLGIPENNEEREVMTEWLNLYIEDASRLIADYPDYAYEAGGVVAILAKKIPIRSDKIEVYRQRANVNRELFLDCLRRSYCRDVEYEKGVYRFGKWIACRDGYYSTAIRQGVSFKKARKSSFSKRVITVKNNKVRYTTDGFSDLIGGKVKYNGLVHVVTSVETDLTGEIPIGSSLRFIIKCV